MKSGGFLAENGPLIGQLRLTSYFAAGIVVPDSDGNALTLS